MKKLMRDALIFVGGFAAWCCHDALPDARYLQEAGRCAGRGRSEPF